MRRSSGSGGDWTADAAVGNVSGESLLTAVLERIPDEFDRVLVLAHIGLDTPLAVLARDLKLDRRELASRLQDALDGLRGDDALAQQLVGIRRAGKHEHYQALAFRLNLQDWFCSHCGGLMVQQGIGRPRNTCSQTCRRRLYEAGGIGWKDEYRPGAAARSQGPNGRATEPKKPQAAQRLQLLMRPIEAGEGHTDWRWPNIQVRDRAMLLLGFTCPVDLSPSDLAALDINDIRPTSDGFEVRLFKRAQRLTRHVKVPARADLRLCAARAMEAWLHVVTRPGFRASDPLFVWLKPNGQIANGPRRYTANAIAARVNYLLLYLHQSPTAELTAARSFGDFFEDLKLDPSQGLIRPQTSARVLPSAQDH